MVHHRGCPGGRCGGLPGHRLSPGELTGVSTAAERWTKRQTRRLARDASRLAEEAGRFAAAVDRFPGPYTGHAESVVRSALGLLRLAASVDGMQEVNDLMTEE